MRTSRLIASLIMLILSTPALANIMPAPDQTPLLYDRVRAFPIVVVAAPVEDFQNKTIPERGTNSVLLPLKITRTLKGDAKDTLRLSVHGNLPKMLAERDPKGGSYLIVAQQAKDYAYLGAANLYGDLARFIPTDPTLEKIVEAFIAAKDEAPTALARLCVKLLDEKDLSDPAADAIFELLGRSLPKAEIDAKELSAAVEAIQKRLATNRNAGTTALVFRGLQQRPDAADHKPAADSVAAIRKWLEETLAGEPRTIDWTAADQVTAAVEVLLANPSPESQKVLDTAANQQRFPNAARMARTAKTAAP